jgi:hypothetical protein
MEETSESDAAIRQQLTLAKVLLRKFNLLHDFHVLQLQRFTIACCSSALGGEVAINPEERLVSFDIKTSFEFKRVNKKISKRHAVSPVKIWKRFKPQTYEKELEIAKSNLSSWTKELLWGEDTRIRITIDGQEV